ncbi:hypothetical protein HanXRQr2_Chr08g0325891 [Helianthus annuus]|uniref:Uncharacterized protein n=1 Tax=Helianthus annuus TaxID=4232 RepID=A0A9K3NC02_HELAN|nr:hypothetical protein HanXRQr2_Chr08g0325891 [Helianthus annuus]
MNYLLFLMCIGNTMLLIIFFIKKYIFFRMVFFFEKNSEKKSSLLHFRASISWLCFQGACVAKTLVSHTTMKKPAYLQDHGL